MKARVMIKRPIQSLSVPILALPRPVKRFVALCVDLSLCILTVWLSFYLRLGEFISFIGQSEWAQGALCASTVSVVIAIPLFITSGLYRAIFRYSDGPALQAVSRAISLYAVFYAAIFSVFGVAGVPRTVGLIQPILLLLFVGVSRAVVGVWLGAEYRIILKRVGRPNVLVYGAGDSGRRLVMAMRNSHEMEVAGFLDDDEQLQGNVLNGQPIYDPDDLPALVKKLNINTVLLAMPSINRKRQLQILNEIRKARVSVRTLPSVTELAQGRVSVSDLRDLDNDDLLGREAVMPNQNLLGENIRGKVVAVTGAGGSIGSELCRQIMNLEPTKLLLIDHSEFALYSINEELEDVVAGRVNMLVPLLASVHDEPRMHEIMTTWHPDTVYHTAAYKHVPIVERNLAEGIRNNVLGTLRTARVAVANKVSDFVFISTDKAVRPTNVMGASKRLAEMILQALAATDIRTKFSIVRFGNVLGTSGSVVPKFRQQIRDGGPITITHPDISRYFMTITEASQLVIQAGAMAKGGEVFVLDMGQPVKIMELAHRMVELSGLKVKNKQNPDGDIEIEITQLRPGEKLYEELLIGDNPTHTSNSKIMKAEEEFIPWTDLERKLDALEKAIDVNDVIAIRTIMEALVSGYTAIDKIVDWIFMEQEGEKRITGM